MIMLLKTTKMANGRAKDLFDYCGKIAPRQPIPIQWLSLIDIIITPSLRYMLNTHLLYAEPWLQINKKYKLCINKWGKDIRSVKMLNRISCISLSKRSTRKITRREFRGRFRDQKSKDTSMIVSVKICRLNRCLYITQMGHRFKIFRAFWRPTLMQKNRFQSNRDPKWSQKMFLSLKTALLRKAAS